MRLPAIIIYSDKYFILYSYKYFPDTEFIIITASSIMYHILFLHVEIYLAINSSYIVSFNRMKLFQSV